MSDKNLSDTSGGRGSTLLEVGSLGATEHCTLHSTPIKTALCSTFLVCLTPRCIAAWVSWLPGTAPIHYEQCCPWACPSWGGWLLPQCPWGPISTILARGMCILPAHMFIRSCSSSIAAISRPEANPSGTPRPAGLLGCSATVWSKRSATACLMVAAAVLTTLGEPLFWQYSLKQMDNTWPTPSCSQMISTDPSAKRSVRIPQPNDQYGSLKQG